MNKNRLKFYRKENEQIERGIELLFGPDTSKLQRKLKIIRDKNANKKSEGWIQNRKYQRGFQNKIISY